MKNYKCDISFMQEIDSKFWDTGNDLSKVAATIYLEKEPEDLSEDEIKILNGLHNNIPVKYRDGIFRISKVGEVPKVVETESPSEDEKIIWEVEITGFFTSEDPNGQETNGWTDEELAQKPTKTVNSIETLDL
jgi:hypothetical protein